MNEHTLTKKERRELRRTEQSDRDRTPRSKNTAPIAFASWGRLQELTEYDEGTIVAFIKANKNKSPEALAR